MAKIYALLVGINDYPVHVGRLQGCLNDIANVEDYLSDFHSDAAVVTLRNADATYANVIAQFRQHLGQAGKDDVALFHYCGHGARATSSIELREFDRDNRDEGLVCIDSRDGDNFDLADKELALLLREIAANDPHIAMVLDCCNSGSGTRLVEDGPQAGVRTTASIYPPRPLASYLEGQFAEMLARAEPLTIPASRHLLMAACDRSQTAKEDLDTHQGFFTTALYDVLRRSDQGLTYADLFVRSRAAVRRAIRDRDKTPQDPQFETYAGFDAYWGFLGGGAQKSRPSYSVYHGEGRWMAECGALHGLSTDPAVPVALILRDEPGGKDVAGSAQAISIGAQTSVIVPDFDADPAARYWAEIASMPPAPLLIAFTGPDAVRTALETALADNPAHGAVLVDEGSGDGPILRVSGGTLQLAAKAGGPAIGSVALNGLAPGWAAPLLPRLLHIAQWQRTLKLDNASPKLNRAKVLARFVETSADGTEQTHEGLEISLAYRRKGPPNEGEWIIPRGTLQIANHTAQVLNYALIHFSEDFGVTVLANDQIAPGGEFQTIMIDAARNSAMMNFTLDHGDEGLERLKIIVSTERMDDFRFTMAPLSVDRGIINDAELAEAEKIAMDDWFAIAINFHIARLVDAIGAEAVSLAEGQVEILPHPAFTAQIALGTAPEPARAVGDYARLLDQLAATSLAPARLGGSRGAAVHSIELSDIGHPEALARQPLEMRITAPLADGEMLVPLVHDGKHILLAGDFWQGNDGATHISIDHLPTLASPQAAGQRSIGSALKLYLFKTYLGAQGVNSLRRAEFAADGSFTYQSDRIAENVAAAENVLVVLHGIIGDTKALLGGVSAAGLDRTFDCVLAYDYENLATLIGDTAHSLKSDLAKIGLGVGHGKKVTLLAHSMGGLVSRYFIEREGGDSIVDHLVMCGTPNQGSPFGRIATARKVLEMLATIGVNFAPQLCGPALMVLGRSKKLTPTLEQMDPDSDFLAELNTGAAPNTRYTILAGDVDRYQSPPGSSFAELIAKVGRGTVFDALFSNRANDIAVAVDSIVARLPTRSAATVRIDAACHHLNYFTDPAGIAALSKVAWQT